MKKILLLLILPVVSVFAQQTDFEQVVEAEQKAAFNLQNFTNNENTGNYDMTHVVLNFTVDPNVQFVSGTISTTYIAKENMQTITFELNDALSVSSVTQNGSFLSFTQNNNDELVITLPAVQQQGTEATVTVNYSGAPSFIQDSFVASQHAGTPILWTLSEPYGAKEWWPCKQDLNDKIDEGIDVYITAPSQYVSVSNGVEQSQTNNSNGTTTTHFTHNYPIPAYLIAIAVTNYNIYTQQAGTAPNTFPVVNYLYPENEADIIPLLDQTPAIMSFFEEVFEQYPFSNEKYGHAQWSAGGGMEHTTVSFMGSFGREIVAHELAHQWFGDKITCGSWKDIWLNEGFATYLSGLVVEDQDGDFEFRSWRAGKISNIVSQPDGSVYLTDNDTLDESRIFNTRLTYNKGAMVLHMLRYKIGDAAFFQGLKNYLADDALAYAYAKTPQLQQHLEETSGMDLQEFFNDWVYNQGYPTYNITVVNNGFGNVLVTINQTQSDPSVSFFEMPVSLRFASANGNIYETIVDNTFNGQQFTISLPFSDYSEVLVNYNFDIICAENTVTLGTDSTLLNGVTLYPNPALQAINLAVPQGMVIQHALFYNELGQKVLETNNETSWDISQWASGSYIARIKTGTGTKDIKFVKQ
ncbi:M1 family aminopeptidase [Flavobacterium rhizosphaerae]|uniref:Aminopeptidase N n=1 Tax=Flavobacterium rhizosphaerae TaxID=3163298 RepID=A0ABW8YXJ4_9FLAO